MNITMSLVFICICHVQICMDWVPGFLHTCFYVLCVQLCLLNDNVGGYSVIVDNSVVSYVKWI